jgi:hypothetical protein
MIYYNNTQLPYRKITKCVSVKINGSTTNLMKVPFEPEDGRPKTEVKKEHIIMFCAGHAN